MTMPDSEAAPRVPGLLLGGFYRHYKNKHYRLVDVVRHSESLEPLVLYQALYDNPMGMLWVRPAAMFAEEVEVDGGTIPRFALQIDTGYRYYHAHVYYTLAQREAAAALHAQVRQRFGGRVQLSPLIDQPVGPHPLPMFEIDIFGADAPEIIGWLANNHGALDVFIHPVSEDEMRDHTELAMFLGRRHALDIERLAYLLAQRAAARGG